MAPEAVLAAATQLVQAGRILVQKQIIDAFGHISTRHPLDPGKFLISRNMAPAMAGVADIMTLDTSGEPCDGDTRRPFLERFIHAAIYYARPDVGSVVHSHSPAVIPFGVVPAAPLRPIYHMAGFLADEVARFEIRDVAGDSTDMLVRTPALGVALAQALGNGTAILMRGHGSTVVGSDVPEAVFRAVYLEANARIQADAMRLGSPTFLSPREAACAATSNASQISRAWDCWCREVED